MSDSYTDTAGYLNMDLLRFTTAGSVDDGKSTLIGRLLYDSKNTFEDQMEAVEPQVNNVVTKILTSHCSPMASKPNVSRGLPLM